MTILLKASDMAKKSDALNIPLVVDVEIQKRAKPRESRTSRLSRCCAPTSPFCTTVVMCVGASVVLLLVGTIVYGLGVIIYKTSQASMATRYKGYCAIPIDVAQILQNPQAPEALQQEERVPLQWSDAELVAPPERELARLLEHFDIDGSVERVAVYNGGSNVEFIHDFSANATGIVEKNRCFVMPLDPAVVVTPHMFVMSIARGDGFDVRRVRARLHAVLPPAAAAAAVADPAAAGPAAAQRRAPALAEACRDRPAYALHAADDDDDQDYDTTVAIRKRSIEDKKPEYMHFSGRFVQEITIDNMAELLEYEKKATA